MFDFETLARLRSYLRVKHHIPGRIRIGFDPEIANQPEARKLGASSDSLPDGILGVRLNVPARSVVIEYDSQRIPPDYLQELAQTDNDARAAEIVQELYQILTKNVSV